MTTADNKLRAIPRLVRDGKLRDALPGGLKVGLNVYAPISG